MRRAAAVLALLLLLGAAAVSGAAWHYTNVLDSGALRPDRDLPQFDLRVVSLGDGTITLTRAGSPNDDWRRDGVWGLQWQGGYGRLRRIVKLPHEQVAWEFTTISGQPRPGDLARVDSYAFPGDPLQASDMLFLDVTIPSDVGDLPAWFVPAPAESVADTLVIFVHGKDADRRQALRVLPAIHGLGIPFLAVSYRNDGEAPDGPDKRYRYGLTEWRDLEAALVYARGLKVAGHFVLFGYSMGGAIVMSFLEHSPLAQDVGAVILDAPVLDFEAVVDLGAERRGLPRPLTALAKWLADQRFDIGWDAVDYLARADELALPVLLFHGDADTTVPIDSSEALARARPDLVTFVRVAGAGHVRSWNADPQAYEAALTAFLRRILQID